MQNKIAGLGSFVANFIELETSNFWYQNKTKYNKNNKHQGSEWREPNADLIELTQCFEIVQVVIVWYFSCCSYYDR